MKGLKEMSFFAMMHNIRGIRDIRETWEPQRDKKTVHQCYYKGKEKLAMAVISLENSKENKYFAQERV